jgi:hypothetical protein
MYIFKELETFSVAALNDVELGNNQGTTNLVTDFLGLTSESSSQSGAREPFRCSLFRTFLKMRVYSRIARVFKFGL